MDYIYLLTNPFMPGLVKIGKTKNHPSKRKAELQTTGVPGEFEIECAFGVDDCTKRERDIHRALAMHRIPRREFFQIDVDSALRVVVPLLGNFTILESKSTYQIEALSQCLREQAERKRIQKEERDRYAVLKAETERAAREGYLARKAEMEAKAGDQIDMELAAVEQWHRSTLASKFAKTDGLWTSFGAGGLTLIASMVTVPDNPSFAFKASIVAAFAGGWVLRKGIDFYKYKSNAYLIFIKEYEQKRDQILHHFMVCPHCRQNLRFKRYDVLIGSRYLDFECPACQEPLIISSN